MISWHMVRVWSLSTVAVVGVLPGCVEDEGSATGSLAVGTPAVDPRFATAGAFVEHFNTVTDRGSLSLFELLEMVYAETDEQRDFADQLRLFAQAEEPEHAYIEAFGSPLSTRPGYAPLRAELSMARLVEVDNRRATATVVDRTWQLSHLMLVEMAGRWWISGHTWDDAVDPPVLKELRQYPVFLEVGAAVGPPHAARVRAGEFSDIERARDAYRQALKDFLNRNPDIEIRYREAGGTGGR